MPILGPFYTTELRAELVGKTVLGMRVDDVIRAVDLLAAADVCRCDEHSCGWSGHMGLVLLHAAALDPRLKHITVDHVLERYRGLLDAPMPVDAPQDIFRVLLKYDIPDVARVLRAVDGDGLGGGGVKAGATSPDERWGGCRAAKARCYSEDRGVGRGGGRLPRATLARSLPRPRRGAGGGGYRGLKPAATPKIEAGGGGRGRLPRAEGRCYSDFEEAGGFEMPPNWVIFAVFDKAADYRQAVAVFSNPEVISPHRGTSNHNTLFSGHSRGCIISAG